MTKKTNNSSQQVVEIDLLQVASTLWQHIISILLTGIIFGALLFGYARFFVTPKYEANALFYVNNSTFSLSSAVAISTGELSAAMLKVDNRITLAAFLISLWSIDVKRFLASANA